jgi:hypothetical protein
MEGCQPLEKAEPSWSTPAEWSVDGVFVGWTLSTCLARRPRVIHFVWKSICERCVLGPESVVVRQSGNDLDAGAKDIGSKARIESHPKRDRRLNKTNRKASYTLYYKVNAPVTIHLHLRAL